jgi:hypothetical protein
MQRLTTGAIAKLFDICHGLEAGFFRHLTNPFKIDEFLEVLDLASVFALHVSLVMSK